MFRPNDPKIMSGQYSNIIREFEMMLKLIILGIQPSVILHQNHVKEYTEIINIYRTSKVQQANHKNIITCYMMKIQ